MASEGCSTPAPTESSTRTPERSSTPAPAESSTLAPAESSTLAPAERSTPAPASSSTPAPPGSFTLTPEGSSTLVPTEISTLAPAESSTFAPAESSSTPAPAEISTLAPTEISILAPTEISTLAPASSSTSPPPAGNSTSAPKDCFTAVSSNPKWKEGLESSGSCSELYDLLQNRPELIHELGPDDITVLHKGVDHGCVKLVRFVLVDMFNEAGICKCRGEENGLCTLTREGLLRKTDTYGSTAVNVAIVSGSPKMVLLLEWAIRVSSKDMKTVNTVKRTSHPVAHEQYYELLKLVDSEYYERYYDRSGEVEPVVNEVDEVPDVKDDEISTSIYLQEQRGGKITYDRDMQLELYKVIAAKLNETYTCEDRAVLNFLKEKCAKNVDFEFVPVEHIFLHFLISYGKDVPWEIYSDKVEEIIRKFLTRFIEDIVAECKMWDEKNERTDTMQMTLFSILDPRGRTIMHTLFYSLLKEYGHNRTLEKIVGILKGVASEGAKPWRCYIAKDGAGRTLYHMASIYENESNRRSFFGDALEPEQYSHMNIVVTPLCNNEFRALQEWSCEGMTLLDEIEEFLHQPIYFAVLFSSEDFMSVLLPGHSEENFDDTFIWYSPFMMASSLGRTKLVEQFLKHQVQFKNIRDRGFDGCKYYYPALHCAAACGQAEVLQMILKYPIYDPMCKDNFGGDTALHEVVKMESSLIKLENLKLWALQHVHPNTNHFRQIEGLFQRHEAIRSSPRDFTKNEKICINLLLQAGIDVWTPNEDGEFPNVGSKANNEARSWWYEKVVKEVEIKRASITSAANATSLIGALVATTSFIGPLQPPLSYSPNGYVDASPVSIRIYLVCNNISFFFSIASILMAVLPSIPMPKESLFEEMIRSERCLKAAITFLLISIICILVSFSSANLAVVSSKWHDRKLIVASLVIGGGVCVVVLVIFIIRLLRMVFHKNSWLRRKFAKHMYF